MAISKMSNGFYTFSDSYFKAMRKQDLINYIRTIEKNWENSLITNGIQYENCKRLLAEERNKAIDEFAERLKKLYQAYDIDLCLQDNDHLSYTNSRIALESYIDEIAEQMKVGE